MSLSHLGFRSRRTFESLPWQDQPQGVCFGQSQSFEDPVLAVPRVGVLFWAGTDFGVPFETVNLWNLSRQHQPLGFCLGQERILESCLTVLVSGAILALPAFGARFRQWQPLGVSFWQHRQQEWGMDKITPIPRPAVTNADAARCVRSELVQEVVREGTNNLPFNALC